MMKKELFIYFAIFTAANFLAFAVTLFAKTFTAFTGS